MKFILASHNKGKLAEMQKILGELGVEVVLQSDLGLDLEPEEDGATFTENARIKARAVMEASGMPAIADDSGLMVDALDGAPGVYSARYGGSHDRTDEERYRYLLSNLENVPDEKRSAKFVSVITLLYPDGHAIVARGECPGTILHAPRGENGFGYDPVFFVTSEGKSMAELSPERKNEISHRARALQVLAARLEEEAE